MQIPYIDLNAQYQSIKQEIDAAIAKVINNSAFVLGPAVAEFETSFAEYCGVRHCIGVNSGTNALLLALKALDIGHGDEVITAANTFIATVEAIVHSGAHPVLVDVDPHTRNIDSTLLKMALSQKTKAIIPVHLYGQTADMDPINALAKKYDIAVLEDAAQAHGAAYKGHRAGSLGNIAAFSFYPAKNLGAFGEAGAVTTDDDGLAENLRMLRDHGSKRKYFHNMLGYNARMSGIQGAVLSVKLKHLDQWNEARIRIAGWYDELLEKAPVVLPQSNSENRCVYHVYVIETEQRDELQKYLKNNQIPTIIHYPVPTHLQEAFGYLDYQKGDFPVTEKLANEALSLPIYPEMKREQIEFVCKNIRDFFSGQ
ncbi:MAG: DegT/DnrJ/EryC1/StrS family aminotransferase [candidate division Zixibacteria bacterium]|nr:DegT/DnrJ/EryC1/StrS family aminotransferase [candidate division Zixibacteria bacterium]